MSNDQSRAVRRGASCVRLRASLAACAAGSGRRLARGACSSPSPVATSSRACSTRPSASSEPRRRRSAYLILIPLQFGLDAPMSQECGLAIPLLEAVEHAASRARVPVDARIESARTPIHALRRL